VNTKTALQGDLPMKPVHMFRATLPELLRAWRHSKKFQDCRNFRGILHVSTRPVPGMLRVRFTGSLQL